MIKLSKKIIDIINEARSNVIHFANTSMVVTYFEIGKMLVEELQLGETRAEYGANLLFQVSKDLTQNLGKGFSVQNIERMRNFYLVYSNSSKALRNSDIFLKSSNELRISKNHQKALVEITLPKENNQIFATKYQTYLPTKTELQKIINQYE